MIVLILLLLTFWIRPSGRRNTRPFVGNEAHFTRLCIQYQLDLAREDAIGALCERAGRARPDFQLVEPEADATDDDDDEGNGGAEDLEDENSEAFEGA